MLEGMRIEDHVFLNLQELPEFSFKSNPLRVFQTLNVLKLPYSLQSSTGQMVIVCLEFCCFPALNRCSQDRLIKSGPSYFFSLAFCFWNPLQWIRCVMEKRSFENIRNGESLFFFFNATALIWDIYIEIMEKKNTREIDSSLSFQGIIINREKYFKYCGKYLVDVLLSRIATNVWVTGLCEM